MTSTKAVALLLLCLAPAVGAAPLEHPTSSLDVRLTDVRGSVLITTADGKTRGAPPVYLPFVLAEGDYVRTLSSATAEIAMAGGTLVQLAPNGAVRLAHLALPQVELELRSGVLLARVQFEKNEGNQFRVVTPSAIATVRGTELVVEESGTHTRVAVLDEGHVAVTAPGFKKIVMLHFNQETQVSSSRAPQDAHVLERLYHHKIQMAQMRQRTKLVRRQWKTIPESQLQRVRSAWIQHNTPSAKR